MSFANLWLRLEARALNLRQAFEWKTRIACDARAVWRRAAVSRFGEPKPRRSGGPLRFCELELGKPEIGGPAEHLAELEARMEADGCCRGIRFSTWPALARYPSPPPPDLCLSAWRFRRSSAASAARSGTLHAWGCAAARVAHRRALGCASAGAGARARCGIPMLRIYAAVMAAGDVLAVAVARGTSHQQA
jgi:hypothetical protein